MESESIFSGRSRSVIRLKFVDSAAQIWTYLSITSRTGLLTFDFKVSGITVHIMRSKN